MSSGMFNSRALAKAVVDRKRSPKPSPRNQRTRTFSRTGTTDNRRVWGRPGDTWHDKSFRGFSGQSNPKPAPSPTAGRKPVGGGTYYRNDPDARRMQFNPNATLDPSQVTDRRSRTTRSGRAV